MAKDDIFKQEGYDIQIIRYLASLNDFATSYDIAEYIGLNRRLVREEVPHVQDLLNQLGYQFISQIPKGYMICFKDSLDSIELIKKLEEYERNQHFYLDLIVDRSFYIAQRIIEANEGLKIDDLVEECYVSRSTLSKELKNIREWFTKHDLQIISKANHGMYVIGKEINKRIILSDIIFINYKHSYIMYDFLSAIFENKETLDYHIIKILKKYNIVLSSISLTDFLVYILVTISRINMKHYLEEVKDLPLLDQSLEMLAAKDIAQEIEKTIQLPVSQNEIKQLAIELYAKETTSSFTYDTEMTNLIVDESINMIYQKHSIDFNDNEILKTQLFNIVDKSLFHSCFQTKQRNTYYNKVENKYALSYQLAICVQNVIYQLTKQQVSMSDLSLITILFEEIIYSIKTQKQKALFLCTLDTSLKKLIFDQIQFHFGNYIHISKCIDLDELFSENLTQYDYILSTVSIHVSTDIPVIVLPEFLDNNMIQYVKNLFIDIKQLQTIEFIFEKRLYFHCTNIKSYKMLIDELYKKLITEIPSLSGKLKKQQLALKNIETIETCPHVLVIQSSNFFAERNMILTMILDESLQMNNRDIKIVLFLSMNSHLDGYINIHSLMNQLQRFVTNDNLYQSFLKQPSYVRFIQSMKKSQ